MGIAEAQVDFPRGGGSVKDAAQNKKSATKRKNETALFGDGKKKAKTHVTEKAVQNPKVKSKEVWTKPITLDLLSEGVQGLGVVREIHDDQLRLETSNGCQVRLPATEIGKHFTDLLKGEEITLEDAFVIGQMVPFRVTKRMTKTMKNGKKTTTYPSATCDPAKLNSHLVPNNCVSGLVLHAVVESSEEKGYMLDLGLQFAKGFLPFDKSPKSELRTGFPVLVRVESTTSRIIKVNGFVEQDTLSVEAAEKLHMNQLMPGTIIECDPLLDQQSTSGIYVSLGNDIHGFIARRYLPPRLRADTSRLLKSLRCVVLFCQQNSNLLVLSAHPDIIAISKPEKRSLFEGIEIGDKLMCTVIDIIPSKSLVFFSLPTASDGKASLISASSSKSYLDKPEECEKIYKVGSTHLCRVLDFRFIERSLVVATRKDIIKQKMISYKDAIPGDLAKAKVINTNAKGVNVTIFNSIRGFMPLHLASDKNVALDKMYPKDKEFNCRILNVDAERKQVTITAKQSLVKHKGANINSYNDEYVGRETVGIISKIFPSGALLVAFYDSVLGVLPVNEAKKLRIIPTKDKPILVKVESVDAGNNKIQLRLPDEYSEAISSDRISEESDLTSVSKKKVNQTHESKETEHLSVLPSREPSSELTLSHEKTTKNIKNFKIYNGIVVGPWDYAECHSNFCVKVKLPGGHLGRLHISEFPSKSLLVNNPFSVFVKSHIDKKVITKVIGFTTLKIGTHEKLRVADLTMNEDKLSYTRIREKLLGYKQHFKDGQMVKCYVSSNMKTSHVKVEISPITFGTIPREALTSIMLPNKTSEGALTDVDLPIGSALPGTVTGATRKNGNFYLTLTPSGGAAPSNHISKFNMGQLLTGRILNINLASFGVLIQLSTGQQALLGPTGISGNYKKINDYIKKFHKGELYSFFSLRKDEKPRRYHVITEGRYKQHENNPNDKGPTALLSNLEDVSARIGQHIYGFLCYDKGAEYVLVEIGPGIRGRMKKDEIVDDLPLNSVISVVIESVDEDKKTVQLVFDKVISTPLPNEISGHIETFSGKDSTAKEVGEKLMMEDPGFEWDNAGFTPDELASVGKMNINSSLVEVSQVDEKTTSKKAKRSIHDKTVKTSNNDKHDLLDNDEDFDQLLRKDPNSADIWIKYMSHFLEKGDISNARATAERSLTVISYREEAEIFNIWTAYLNLEVLSGNAESTKNVFDRACSNADSLKIHKQMALIFIANGKTEEADEIFNTMIRKFRASSDDVWHLYADHLMSTERAEEGRNLLYRALSSIPKTRHAQLISRFAQLEYYKGDAERGRTLFENLVTAYPKKTDLWMVYVDLSLKYSGIEIARQILEKACNLPLNAHKLRPLFKKWMEIEEKHGDEQSKQLVCSRAQRFLHAQEEE